MEIKAKEIKLIEIDELVPNPRNPNKHNKKQLDLLEKLITKNGFRNPIIVSNRSGFIVCGHARLEVAKKLEMEKLPVIFQDYKNEAEEFKHLNADNEVARLAEFDKNMFLDTLDDMGEDLEDTDYEDYGLIDFDFERLPEVDEKKEVNFDASEADKKYIIEVQFPNEMEMMDIHDDLHHRGYIVKVRDK